MEITGKGRGELTVTIEGNLIKLSIRYGKDKANIELTPDHAKMLAGALNTGARLIIARLLTLKGEIVGPI